MDIRWQDEEKLLSNWIYKPEKEKWERNNNVTLGFLHWDVCPKNGCSKTKTKRNSSWKFKGYCRSKDEKTSSCSLVFDNGFLSGQSAMRRAFLNSPTYHRLDNTNIQFRGILYSTDIHPCFQYLHFSPTPWFNYITKRGGGRIMIMHDPPPFAALPFSRPEVRHFHVIKYRRKHARSSRWGKGGGTCFCTSLAHGIFAIRESQVSSRIQLRLSS